MSPLGELIKMCVQLFTRWHDSHAKIMPDVHAAAVQRLNAKRGKEGLTHVHAHNHMLDHCRLHPHRQRT